MNQQSATSSSHLPWSTAHRRALLPLLSILWLFLVIQALRNRVELSDLPPSEGQRAAELADRIDPNTADWQTLAAIPTLGEKRAREIVRYREQFVARGRGPVPFQSADDLLRIRGIGAATLANLRRHLRFPALSPATHRHELVPRPMPDRAG